MSYTPIRNDNFTEGVVLNQEQFKIEDNGFVLLQNLYPWRNRIKQRLGNRKLGRLKRDLTSESLGNTTAATSDSVNLITDLSLESTGQIDPGTVVITIAAPDTATFTDQGDGTFAVTGIGDAGTSSINYATGAVVLGYTGTATGGAAITADLSYFPGLPVMGIHQREIPAINDEESIIFDTKYAYTIDTSTGILEEYIPGTTWSGTNSDFFWATNFWQDGSQNDLFWTTNFSGPSGDPIRYTNGTAWTDFTPAVDGTNSLFQCQILVPFRGLMLALNTYEGTSLGASINYPQRVRGSQIGSPLDADAWRDDIPGKGFFFDLPTNEAITAIGFVRDDLVVFCERSSWLLSFTGNSSVPIVDQRENTDLGVESTFSVLNFDDNIVGVGDKYVVSSNAVDTRAINDKIPDFAFNIHNGNNGRRRVHGVRDYNERLAYWTYPEFEENTTFPGNILVWNYVDNNWSFFRDNITTFGFYNQVSDITWDDVTWTWAEWTSTWNQGLNQSQYPEIIGGNQHGYIMIMHRELLDDSSMPITSISLTGDQVQLEIVNHNLRDGEVIRISNIIGDYSDLNDVNYQVQTVDEDTVNLFVLDVDGNIIPATHSSEIYLGGGEAALIAKPIMRSKKFNFIDKGKKILIAYIDLLMNKDENATYTLNMYQDYRNVDPLDTPPFWSRNIQPIPSTLDTTDQDKVFFKCFVGSIGNFIQYEITIADEILMQTTNGIQFQLDSVVLYVRPTGRLTV